MNAATVISGTLHIMVAFDWGEEIDFAHASRLVLSEPQALPRRRRTPHSIAYRPSPLRIRLADTKLDLPEIGECAAQTEATVFDFAATSLTFRVPLRQTAEQLSRLADALALAEPLVEKASLAMVPLYEQLLPAIKNPALSSLNEVYFVFQLNPDSGLPAPVELLQKHNDWLAGLVRLENSKFSPEEVSESLRLRLSYTPDDLVIIEWAAAVVIDQDCEETLQTIEFANLQLLEYRSIDDQVGKAINQAYGLIRPLASSWLPFWRLQTRPLRVLSEMRINAIVLIERASSALKLVGDQYVSRVYRLLATRFRLEEWSQGIRQSLDETQGVHETLSQQSATYRIELLEIIIVVLILIEIVLAFVRH